MISLKHSEFLYVEFFIIVNVLYIVCVCDASLRTNTGKSHKDSAMPDSAIALLATQAEYICYDLQIYDNDISLANCEKNIIKSHGYKPGASPELHVKCHYQSNLEYFVEPRQDPAASTLLVLIPVNYTRVFPTYVLIKENDKRLRTWKGIKEQYTTWTTMLFPDGSHTAWRAGPDIRPWNYTGDKPERNYDIQVKYDHELHNGSSTVTAYFSWEAYDDDDTCFNLDYNFCDGDQMPARLDSPSDGNKVGRVSGLPPRAWCSLRLVGRYGTTLFRYKTPDCETMECMGFGSPMVQNISLATEPGSAGWDVYVSWERLREPSSYNLTLTSEHVKTSLEVPGTATEAIFTNVKDYGTYTVAIGSVMDDRTAWTSARAFYPVEKYRWGALGTALGGAWGALACCGALLAALALAWRRRRDAALRHVYFPEPEDKPPKEGDYEGADHESIAADDWELRSERLLLHEVIGEGAFGVVRRGTLAPAGKEVAVKMLKDFPTLDELRSFRAEMELMKSVGAHPHIVSLVGCCSGRRPFIVAEYCNRGDLLSYLRCSWDVMLSKRNAKYYNNNVETTDYRNDLFKCKLQGEHSKLVVNKLYDLQGICDTDLTSRDLLSFCRQIAMGMEFLASNRLVHRDLAARNVLVSSDRTLKIADFGLSRDVYEENQYKQKGNGKMPMKWMALESLTHRIYTTQSDVWSFGVVMWEVGSVGGSPYAGVPPARLPRLLRAGYRMPRPANCTKQLYEVMLSCWRAHPRERPTFVELHARLDELLNSACAHDYLSLELGADDAPPSVSAHKYVTMIIRDKLGWSRGDSYSRPMRTVQSNHYSSPPACVHKVQSVS